MTSHPLSAESSGKLPSDWQGSEFLREPWDLRRRYSDSGMVRDEYKAAAWIRMERMVSRWAEPILHSRKAGNQAEWAKKENWVLGFYFSSTDSRLWVPARKQERSGREKRVINFGHPLGRGAMKTLALAYGAGLVFVSFLIAAFVSAFR